MRILRVAGVLFLILTLLLGAAAGWLTYNQEKIVALVLDQVRIRTGTVLKPARSGFRFSSHLILSLEDVAVTREGKEVARLRQIRAVISYHSILFNGGTPFYTLRFDHPDVTLPTETANVNVGSVRLRSKIDVKAATDWLDRLYPIAWRIQMDSATLRDSAGAVLTSHFDLLAYRRHLKSRVWVFEFRSQIDSAPMQGTWIAASLRAGTGVNPDDPLELSQGRVWMWDAPLQIFHGKGWRAHGKGVARVAFKLRSDGSMSGDATIGASRLTVDGSALSAPLDLGDYSLDTSFSASSQLVALDKAELRDPKQTLASASGAISEPFGGNPGITAHLSDVAIDVAALKPRVEQIRDRPAYVTTILGYLSSGRLLLSDATATTTFTALQVDFIEALRRDLAFDASIRNGAFSLPEDWKIPTARDLSTQLHYSKATLTATQGTASFGSSTLSEISARADFSHGFNRVPYDFSFRSDADTGELFRAAQTLADSLQLNGRDQVVKARGRLNVDAKASGVFTYERFEPPSDYEVTVEANRFQFEVKDTPGPVELRRGVIVAVPRSVRIDRLDVATTGGDGFVDGDFKIDGGKMTVHQLTVEMHQMPAGLWLPLVVPPDNIKLEGGVGGKIVVKSDPLDPKLFLIDGKLVVGQGKLSFAFLRAPIEFQAATFNFQRRSMVLALPAASLEGGAMNFKLSVADLAQPTLRIDVISQLMDFTVMKFVRLPWIPPGPPPNFPIPVVGHIEVRRGNLAKLQFSDVKADFYRHTDSAWSLYNFSGVTLKGNFAINIIGRAKDDWIQMKGAIAGLDLAALFLLAEDSSRPPMRGKLTIDADLWANTGDDFFATIDGTANVVVGKGRIERLTLLSRMLELIDLRNWLTANIPNPTKSGLPFDTAGGHFSGTEGVFFTDDFVLHGPVMTITAQGSVRMATGDLSMEMAAFPLMTVSWLADKIPIIGGNVASGTSTLLAAYFSVSGPLADPAVRLKPITSVTELVKKMIFLPINLIRPDTVK